MRLNPLEQLYRNVSLVERGTLTGDRRLLLKALRYSAYSRQAGPALLMEACQRLLRDASVIKAVSLICGAAKTAAVLFQRAQDGGGESATSGLEGGSDLGAPALLRSPSAATVESVADTARRRALDEEEEKVLVEYNHPKDTTRVPKDAEAEVGAYFMVLALGMLTPAERENHVPYAKAALEWVCSHNKRSLDYFEARLISLYAIAVEKKGGLVSIREELLRVYRSACQHHNDIGQAVCTNLVLRAYIEAHQFGQARKFLHKTTFPETVSNNQFVRHLLYTGMVHAVHLDYTDAHAALSTALRKAPAATGAGFRASVTKWLVVVELLMGEIPDKSTLSPGDAFMASMLGPYLELTAAVRSGNVESFGAVVARNKLTLQRDGVYNLTQRLRGTVIKAGLKKVAKSYSCISFADVADRLRLGSAEEAEFLCAKAVCDGTIEAVLDREGGCLRSTESMDVYRTSEPQGAFDSRVKWCLAIKREATRSMLYPAKEEGGDVPGAVKDAAEDDVDAVLEEEDDEDMEGDL